MKSLIIEGRYDSLITTLSNKLLQVIKDSYTATTDPDGKFCRRKNIFLNEAKLLADINDDDEQDKIYFEEIENDTIPVEFYLSLKVQWIEDLPSFSSGGDIFNQTTKHADELPLIEIRFKLILNHILEYYLKLLCN